MEPVAMDMKETPKEYVFYADVPGLTKSDIQVSDRKLKLSPVSWIFQAGFLCNDRKRIFFVFSFFYKGTC